VAGVAPRLPGGIDRRMVRLGEDRI
jgi:hypothetical protein